MLYQFGKELKKYLMGAGGVLMVGVAERVLHYRPRDLKNDVGVQSQREEDEVWLAHSTAGVWGDTYRWWAHLYT